jgi:hypothetical protein
MEIGYLTYLSVFYMQLISMSLYKFLISLVFMVFNNCHKRLTIPEDGGRSKHVGSLILKEI